MITRHFVLQFPCASNERIGIQCNKRIINFIDNRIKQTLRQIAAFQYKRRLTRDCNYRFNVLPFRSFTVRL